jgi:hypothetical protein
VESFAKAYDLIKDKSSILYSFLQSMDKTERDEMIEIARKKHNQNLPN